MICGLDECGSGVGGDLRVTPRADSDRTECSADGRRVLQIRRADVADAPPFEPRRRDAEIAEVPEQHAELFDRIVTVDVLRGIGLGIAQSLRVAQRYGEVGATAR